MTDSVPHRGLERALDAALARALVPPQPPAHLRTGLQAAIARAEGSKIADLKSRYEQEQRQGLAELEQQYVRLRRRTLGMMVGGAFAAGALAAVALPWLTARLGPQAPLLVASAGAAIGIWIGVSSWLVARRDPRFPV